MAIKHEIAGYLSQLGSEAPQAEQNSFARFVNANRDLFERHSQATLELRDEEKAWRESPVVTEFVEEYAQFMPAIGSPGQSVKAKKWNKIVGIARENALVSIFGTQEERDAQNKQSIYLTGGRMKKVGAREIAILRQLSGTAKELQKDFHEAKVPIAKEIYETRDELLGKFQEFILSDPSTIFTFQDFLLSKQHAGDREAMRLFLMALVQGEDRLTRENKEGILAGAIKKWKIEYTQNPKPEQIKEFAGTVDSAVIFDWIKFVDHSNLDLRDKLALHMSLSPQSSSWPSALREAYVSFIGSKYLKVTDSLRQGLDPFRKTEKVKSVRSLSSILEDEGEVAETPANSQDEIPQGEKKEEEKTMHPVVNLIRDIGGVYRVNFLTDEALEEFLRKSALRFDHSDPRISEDLANIVKNLRETPRGPGTKNLTNMRISVEGVRHTLRSINPRHRRINLINIISNELRIVFTISENPLGKDQPPIIGIEGIYNHDDYDKRFA